MRRYLLRDLSPQWFERHPQPWPRSLDPQWAEDPDDDEDEYFTFIDDPYEDVPHPAEGQ